MGTDVKSIMLFLAFSEYKSHCLAEFSMCMIKIFWGMQGW